VIALFTDFGYVDPYVGQLHAVLAQEAPGVPIIDLFHAVPGYRIRAAAYLLPAYTVGFPEGTVFVCVVDPGVGWLRRPVFLRADGKWYVGPDNGLFHILARRASRVESYLIRWRPAKLSDSFHGRDLFAPVAARLAQGEKPDCEPTALAPPNAEKWPDDLPEVIYIDHYGNAITGQRAGQIEKERTIRVGRHRIKYARVFAQVPPGEVFWYENANGLVEIAVNQGSACQRLGLALGDTVTFV
jgi:S-adenosyl-L-methionine hydrolase (adenosine-forming)